MMASRSKIAARRRAGNATRPTGHLSLLFLSALLLSATAQADYDSAAEALLRGDHAAGIAEMRSLALAGDARAQDALATMYLKGAGVGRDVAAAMSWYCMLAHHPEGGRGIMQAVWYLAEWFRTGGGFPGQHYNDGDRANEDPIRAYFWFSVMAAQKELFEIVDDDSLRLGQIGKGSVRRALFENEIAAVGEAVKRWRPEQPAGSPQRCLKIPAGVTAQTR